VPGTSVAAGGVFHISAVNVGENISAEERAAERLDAGIIETALASVGCGGRG